MMHYHLYNSVQNAVIDTIIPDNMKKRHCFMFVIKMDLGSKNKPQVYHGPFIGQYSGFGPFNVYRILTLKKYNTCVS